VTGFWRDLADALIGVHYAYLLYVVVGGFLAWRWPRTIWLHILAVIWAMLIVTTSVPCPLTALTNNLRERGGLPPQAGGFIGTYIRGTIYPAQDQALVQVLLAVVVLVSWIGYVYRNRAARQWPLVGHR
jgi:hypothetical protein